MAEQKLIFLLRADNVPNFFKFFVRPELPTEKSFCAKYARQNNALLNYSLSTM